MKPRALYAASVATERRDLDVGRIVSGLFRNEHYFPVEDELKKFGELTEY